MMPPSVSLRAALTGPFKGGAHWRRVLANSVRTLRQYDDIGLVSSSDRTRSGHGLSVRAGTTTLVGANAEAVAAQ